MIRYSCPSCGASLESPTSLAGQFDECPLCMSKNTVPTSPSNRGSRSPSALVWASCIVGLGILLAVLCVWWFIAAPKRAPARAANDETKTNQAAEKVPSNAPPAERVVLIKMGETLARAKGLNPIAVVVEDDSIVMVAGSMRIANGQMGLSNGDMVYNVDSKAIVINGITLQSGECAVVQNGKVEKISDRLKL